MEVAGRPSSKADASLTEAVVAATQKEGFLGCRSPVQDSVSVWKPSEAFNNLAMLFGVAQIFSHAFAPLGFRRVRKLGKQVNTSILMLQIFRMFQWHIKKAAFNCGQLPILPKGQAIKANRKGLLVIGKGIGGTPENVPWKLIQ